MNSKKTASLPKSKRSRGRISKYKKEYCEQLVEHMRGGLSFESFGAEVHVHRDTLYEWAKQHKDFSDAKKDGEIYCLSFWEKAGRSGAFGKTKLDFRFWNRFMLCRFAKFGWNPERHNVTFQDNEDSGYDFIGDDEEN
jgi:hypothetical protein